MLNVSQVPATGDASTAPSVPSVPSALRVRLDEVHVREGFNPRLHFNDEPLARLIESIRDVGLIQAITVRPRDEGGYWLVSGERRLRAMRALGYTEAPAVLGAYDDAAAESVALMENLVRADLAPGEEARAVRRELEKLDGDREELARKLGWPARKLASRLALLHATGAVLDALDRGELKIGHAELLAGLPQDAQERSLPRIIERGVSVDELREQIQGFTVRLDTAIFDHANECAGCPFNSSTAGQQHLFETTIEAGRCSNRECFTGKTSAEIDRRAERLREDYPTVRRASEATIKPILLAATGPTGVGAEQIASGCAGCKFRGVVIEDTAGPRCGSVSKPSCFNAECHAGRVADAIAAQAAQEADAAQAQAQAGGEGEAEGEGGVVRAAPAARKAAGAAPSTATKTVAADLPQRVVDQHAATLVRALTARLPSEPQWSLALALTLLAAEVKDSEARHAILPELDGFERHKAVADVAALGVEAITARIASATAAILGQTDAIQQGRIGVRPLLVALARTVDLDVASHVVIDKPFLMAHTRAAILSLLSESGFEAWMKARENGAKAFTELAKQKREDMIDSILAAGFDWTGYIPSDFKRAVKTFAK